MPLQPVFTSQSHISNEESRYKTVKKLILLLACLLSWSLPAWSLPSPVQCTTKFSGMLGATNDPDIGTFSVTPTVGSYVNVAIVVYAGDNVDRFAATAITDNQGNNYTGGGSTHGSDVFQLAGGADYDMVALFSAKAATSSGTFTVTAHFTSVPSDFMTAMACETTPLAASNALDKTGTVDTTTLPATVTASGANSQANEIIFTLWAGTGGGPPGLPAGYTNLYSDNSAVYSRFAWKAVSAVETSAATAAAGGASRLTGVLATYKDATSGAATSSNLMLLGVGK